MHCAAWRCGGKSTAELKLCPWHCCDQQLRRVRYKTPFLGQPQRGERVPARSAPVCPAGTVSSLSSRPTLRWRPHQLCRLQLRNACQKLCQKLCQSLHRRRSLPRLPAHSLLAPTARLSATRRPRWRTAASGSSSCWRLLMAAELGTPGIRPSKILRTSATWLCLCPCSGTCLTGIWELHAQASVCVPAPAFLWSQCCRGQSNFERGTSGRDLRTVTHESCSRWFSGGEIHTLLFCGVVCPLS